ncbi:MAG: SDR family oxidoreductase, partial [Verrucomicrobia bacterium]|nr:SDR family oxidoreductase [Verrucomicrobiota bacterium]
MSLSFADLQGKNVAITGGGGVLCRSLAEAFVAVSSRVALLDVLGEKAEEAAAALGPGAIGVRCDVLSAESLEAARETVRRRLGPIDILVNGAGGNVPAATTGVERLRDASELGRSFYALGAADFGRAFDLNFLGTLLPCQKLTLDMVERKAGVIINISSLNAFRPLSKIPAYSAAKAAVSNFTQWLAVHLAPAGIRVNAIAPGFFLTEQLRFLALDEEGNWTPRYQRVLAQTPMGRLGKPEELQGAVLFLASGLSSFISGVVLPVDGGFN